MEYKEEWKDVPTWNGVFQVSNYGRVYNTITNNILKGSRKKKGYYEVVLCHKGRRENWQFHVLVATVWKRAPIKGKEDCHHKNMMKCCNCVFNIQIKEKSQHIREHKTGKEGTPHTQQWKRKMSEARKGFKHSQQAKRKMSESRKGRVAWNKGKSNWWCKGKPRSEQIKRKISQAKLGKKRGPYKKKC